MFRTNTRKAWSALVIALLFVAYAGLADAEMKKATIVVDKQAKSKGEVVFSVTPQGGEAQEITITVVEKMKPAEIAGAIAKELSFALSETFSVKPGGNKVTLKPLEKKLTFDLQIANQTVQGISITIK